MTGFGSVPGSAVPGATTPGAPESSGAAAAPPPAAPLVPPGFASPMAWQRQARPSGAPQEVPSQDTGTGADSGTVTATVSESDTGTGTDSAAVTVTVTDSDAGGAAEAASVGVGVSDADTGTGADSATLGPPPVTGTGIIQWLNPVRESVTGLNVNLYLSTTLGATIQFANHGTERLYVLASAPGVTLTVGVSSLVLDEPAESFPSVTLTAGTLYAFGPFHTVLQVPGTSTMQVLLSTAYGVQAVVVQGPDSH
jgi:hypothetical protein